MEAEDLEKYILVWSPLSRLLTGRCCQPGWWSCWSCHSSSSSHVTRVKPGDSVSRSGQGLMMTATANQCSKDERRKIISIIERKLWQLNEARNLVNTRPPLHRQVNGVSEDPGIFPLWSLVLTPAWRCPDPDPCTPTESWHCHNTHSHPVRLTEVKS